MRRLYLAASGLGLSVAVSFAMANPPVFTAPEAAADTVDAFDLFAPPTTDTPNDAPQAADPEAVLREEYLKLMQEKAALMDKAALEAALSTAQQDIKELEAEDLVEEAKAILTRVAEEYAGTRSAQEAAFMLQRQGAVRVPQPEYKPL